MTHTRFRKVIPLTISKKSMSLYWAIINLLKPNDIYIYIYVCVCVCVCRTAELTSRRYILNIYSTNIRTEYFKHVAQCPFFSLQNAVYFIMLHSFVLVLFAFYLQGVLKFKCKIPAPKGYSWYVRHCWQQCDLILSLKKNILLENMNQKVKHNIVGML